VLLVGRDGLSYDEVAERDAGPIGTVRSLVSRVRETLRSVLRGEDAKVWY